MSKQSFEYLLEKYVNGQCTPAEKQLVEQWYELIGKETEMPQDEIDWQQTKAQLWSHIRAQTIDIAEAKELPISTPFKWQRIGWAVAASIVLLLGIGYWFSKAEVIENQLVKTEKEGKVEWKNKTTTAAVVKLSDGSRVRLQPNAQLTVAEAFTDSLREIVLTGDAFFDVTPDPNRPFLVRVGNVVTRVLGTSFWVLNRANKRVEVEVKTGKVAVFERVPKDVKNNGVLLTPNHKVTYFAEDQHFVTGLVEKPEIIKAANVTPISFVFDNTPLSEVVAMLEKGYGIEIELANGSLQNCTLTGDLQHLEMYEKLQVICESLGASYDVRGTSIVLNGKGCE